MDASEIVRRVGDGVKAALSTCELFLGVEEFEFHNAKIHPEYVTAVKVAEQLTGPELVVSLEARMKTLRAHARGLAMMRQPLISRNQASDPSYSTIDAKLAKYGFGKQRLDILVRKANLESPPLLMAEAKLGARNKAGIQEDINRIFRLLEMYEQFDLLDGHDVYGAVVFHAMAQGKKAASLEADASKFLASINEHLQSLSLESRWLRFKAGLLKSAAISKPICGYEEMHDDGTIEKLFAKEEFSFAPGLVLLGNATDIMSVGL